VTQSSLWQDNEQSNYFAEICNALYERELRLLANTQIANVKSVQGRLKSLSYYVNRTASLLTQVDEQGDSPLILDVQNATWSAKQASKISLTGQTEQEISAWYLALLKKNDLSLLGLTVPVLQGEYIILDCIDKVDNEQQRLRTNVSGWFSLRSLPEETARSAKQTLLLKPNKKVMLAACAGHCWQNGHKVTPMIPSLRELLLSCAINWHHFHKIKSRADGK